MGKDGSDDRGNIEKCWQYAN